MLFGLTTDERLRRQFARAGIAATVDPELAGTSGGRIIAVRADAAIDQPLVAALAAKPRLLLMNDDGSVPLAAHVEASEVKAVQNMILAAHAKEGKLKLDPRSPNELDLTFWKALRKRETPYALLVNECNRTEVEWRMFMGTYKGATDLVTKHLWPVPALYVTRFLAGTRVTPNMVTAVGALLMVLAFWLFLRGDFVTGLLAAWFMTFLDTVDGKLARTTLTSSKWGDIFDHGIDLVHPPFWYAAWAISLGWDSETFWWVIGIILGGYVLQRLIEGVSIKWLGLEIHIWRKIDTLFRQITARRNPNLILLTLGVLFGRPDLGLMAVAGWTLICLILHAFQLAQAFSARRNGPLISWMAKP